jgi:hypothetical protein
MKNGEWRMENAEWKCFNEAAALRPRKDEEWRMENGECRMEVLQ